LKLDGADRRYFDYRQNYMSAQQALIPVSARSAKNGNGNALAGPDDKVSPSFVKHDLGSLPLTDELVSKILKGRGLRGWLRLAQVSRVFGLFTLYLFLDTY